MTRWILLSCLLMPTFSSAQTSRTIDFSENPNASTVVGEGIEVTLAPTKSEDGIDVSAAIRVPGYQSIIVHEGGST